jgi:hypothetical protein
VARKSPHACWSKIEGVLVLVQCRGPSQSHVWSEGNSDSESATACHLEFLERRKGMSRGQQQLRVRVSRGRSDHQSSINVLNRSTSLSREPLSCMTVNGQFAPVFVQLNTATARVVYGRWNAHLGHRQYGNRTCTTRTVHPVYTVRFAALAPNASCMGLFLPPTFFLSANTST